MGQHSSSWLLQSLAGLALARVGESRCSTGSKAAQHFRVSAGPCTPILQKKKLRFQECPPSFQYALLILSAPRTVLRSPPQEKVQETARKGVTPGEGRRGRAAGLPRYQAEKGGGMWVGPGRTSGTRPSGRPGGPGIPPPPGGPLLPGRQHLQLGERGRRPLGPPNQRRSRSDGGGCRARAPGPSRGSPRA